jgi:spore photoproduct lyase
MPVELFVPERVYFEPGALEYPLGAELHSRFDALGTPIRIIASHNRVTGIPGDTPQAAYRNAKRTLVVGVKRSLALDTCRPSADFEFTLGTSCPGGCHYCYLQTTLGKKPYVRVYVNLEEILGAVKKKIEARLPETTVFEVSSTSDPLAVEHLTGSLRRTVEWFGEQEDAKLRCVTKFANVEPLLSARHQGRTRFRFSVNSDYVIRHFEPNTAPLAERLEAAGKMREAGYPLGFIVAPLMVYEGWREEYLSLLDRLRAALGPASTHETDLTFELIQFRFTPTSKKVITERFPRTKLDLDEEGRRYKYGKYGRGKWLYPEPQSTELREELSAGIQRLFPEAVIEYFT